MFERWRQENFFIPYGRISTDNQSASISIFLLETLKKFPAPTARTCRCERRSPADPSDSSPSASDDRSLSGESPDGSRSFPSESDGLVMRRIAPADRPTLPVQVNSLFSDVTRTTFAIGQDVKAHGQQSRNSWDSQPPRSRQRGESGAAPGSRLSQHVA